MGRIDFALRRGVRDSCIPHSRPALCELAELNPGGQAVEAGLLQQVFAGLAGLDAQDSFQLKTHALPAYRIPMICARQASELLQANVFVPIRLLEAQKDA